jgi:hypothetical protein
VAASASCTINITFKPTGGGSRTGNLSLTDNAAGSPQTVRLTGSGEDFTVGPASGSSASQTVTPGGTASYTLSFTPQGGLSGTLALSCAGAPSEATCTVSPSPLTLSGSSAAKATVSVTTTAPSRAWRRGPQHLPPVVGTRPLGLGCLVLLALLAMVGLSRRGVAAFSDRYGGRALLRCPRAGWIRAPGIVLATVLLLTLVWTACGGGGPSGPVHVPGTPTGSYALTVTATYTSGSTTVAHTTGLTLTVN